MSTRLVTFTLDGHLYGVDVASVQEVLRGQPQTRVPLAPQSVAGLINLRGQVLSAVEMRARLGLPDRAADQEAMLVVVRVAGETIALLVDSIGAVVDVEEEQFELPPDTLTRASREFLHGAYKLEGQLLLALDVERAVAA
ncbi:chemotaxis protein CheW [Nocardioides jishulii]|uniref:Chemotaxis protein CheW n=1 Tax=Nocardioides jishulii TaxID=2575440 RepID=A0A4U2YTL8_9ACTN|nr:chemotaxis protein CheW [Nocardioides jishulii]QCX28567.1 chemotaxis protein CheW [Nocardioides jishulii]TKI64540.1 chemotaxis protein CheW [Nocardioides jishulii]